LKPISVRDLILGHARLFIAVVIGVASLLALPHRWPPRETAIAAWDIGAGTYLVLILLLFARCPSGRMEQNARAQETGEWTLFFLVLAGVTASFAAILGEFGSMKDVSGAVKGEKVAIVAATLAVSWLLTQAIFALRYAHEFYSRVTPSADLDGGLEFPGEKKPDYWDFTYFSVVLGMTFQVSDVQITSRKLRRLAALHGLLGFVFNTVIIALTVNLASSVL
jgi:uncharacterized membrane protein